MKENQGGIVICFLYKKNLKISYFTKGKPTTHGSLSLPPKQRCEKKMDALYKDKQYSLCLKTYF